MTDSADFDADINWYSNEAATFGDRVAAAREAQGLSRAALARKIGISVRTLDSWENDLSEPRANRLQMLAGVLNVSMPWLLTGEGPGLDQSPRSEVPGELTDLVREMRTLSTQIARSADRIAVLEARLKAATSGEPA